MGIAILSLPNVFKCLGIGLGAILLVLMLWLHTVICKILTKTKNLTGRANYTTMGFQAIPRPWIKPVIKATMILLTFGVSVLNLNVFATSVTDIFMKIIEIDPEGGLAKFIQTKYYIVPIVSVFFIPFALAKNTEKIKYLSYVAVAGTIAFIVCLVIGFFMKMEEIDLDDIGWFITTNTGEDAIIGVFQNIPTLTMAFTFQFNFFSYYKDLENVTDKKMKKVTNTSLISVRVFLR
jgi:amino acid permease